MATFEVQYRAGGSEIKTAVVTASDELAAGKIFRSLHQGISADDVLSVKSIDYQAKYGAANFVAALISFGGWALLAIGVVGVIAGVSIARELFVRAHGLDPANQMFVALAAGGAYFSLVIAIIGVLMAALGQHLRATTDAANHLGEILARMRSIKA